MEGERESRKLSDALLSCLHKKTHIYLHTHIPLKYWVDLFAYFCCSGAKMDP